MPVVEKIESLDLSNFYDGDNFQSVVFNMEGLHCYVFIELKYDPPHRICGESNGNKSKITLIYDQILKFIEYYNKNLENGK